MKLNKIMTILYKDKTIEEIEEILNNNNVNYTIEHNNIYTIIKYDNYEVIFIENICLKVLTV